MADTLVPGLIPGLSPELGDTIFEAPGTLGVVDEENLLTLNLGPQHPSTHGVFRMIMQLQGETVISALPVMGYLHRSSEKLGEARTYVQGTILTDRMDYLSPITTNWAYALPIEDRRVRGDPDLERGVQESHHWRGHDSARGRARLQRDRADPARQRHRLRRAPRRAVLGLRPLRLGRPDPLQRRLLRPLPDP